jgi:hypothetical protein
MKLILENWRKFVNENDKKKLSPEEAIAKEGGALGFGKWEELTGMSRDELEKYVKDNEHIKIHKNGDIIDTKGLSEELELSEDGDLEEKVDKEKMKCNKPKRTPNHPKKSHIVKACEDGKEKIIRFGEQGADTAGAPKKGESKRMKKKRKSFKSRHAKNIKKGKMSAAYWADKVKW